MTPPKTLDDHAAKIWRHMVKSVASDHFAQSDVVLLTEYCRAAAQADKAAEALASEGLVVDGRPSPWITVQEKSQRAMVALSARLRVCPQSRYDRLRAATNSRDQGQSAWSADGLLAGSDDTDADGWPKHGLASFRKPSRRPIPPRD